MEDKIKREVEQGLLLKLREAVNEQEEYDWVLAELARLGAEEAASGTREHPISTVAEAVRFLEEQCGYVAVQTEIVPAQWELVCRRERFSGTYTETEVIQFARGEYGVQVMRSQDEAQKPAPTCPEAQARPASPAIETVADAVGFLAERCDLLAVPVEGGPPLWKAVSLDGEYEALFTERELLEFARDTREMQPVMTLASAKHKPRAVRAEEVGP